MEIVLQTKLRSFQLITILEEDPVYNSSHASCSLPCHDTCILSPLALEMSLARSSNVWEDWLDWGLKTCSRFSRIRSRTTRRARLIRLREELTVFCNSSNSSMNAACFHPIATIATCSENGSCFRSSPNLTFRTIAAISFCKHPNDDRQDYL